MTPSTTCPAKDRPDLTCHLGRIIKETDEGPEWTGKCRCAKCVKATGGAK